VWRCHIGADAPGAYSEQGWDFLRRYVEQADACVFSRASFAPPWLDPARVYVIPPSIDPFSTKNAPLAGEDARRLLAYVGVLERSGGDQSPPAFPRADGSTARVNRFVDVIQTGPAPSADVPLVVQLSRWDRLKDMAGVVRGFAEHVVPYHGAHLVVAGPAVTRVADDPEGAEVLAECIGVWRSLPHAARSRIHLVCVPFVDSEEAAVIASALQRHAAVVVQKSLAEGFGLTVTEAMWKARPVIASAVGGIRDQIDDGVDGLLLDDPADLESFGLAVRRLLDEPALAEQLGERAQARVRERFLPDRHLTQYAQLLDAVERRDPAGTR
jgi:trehalose synthase